MNFDYIIVGAGSAGCVLANRLSANPNNKVLLLEAGGKDNKLEISIPLGYANLYHTSVDWDFKPEPLKHADNQVIFYPRGKVLGGSSAINSMIYIRGNKKDYDEWADLGNKGWSYDEVLPYFKKSENHVNGNSTYHGGNGPLGVTRATDRYENPLWEVVKNAGEEVGLPPNDDFNGEKQLGLGIYDMTIQGGKRQSTAATFLKEAKNRPNLTILTNAHTTKINFEGTTATGVTFQHKKSIKTATASKEVLLSAGALNSPQILMLSGIGDTDYLKSHGIEVVKDLKGVGQNLKDHYFFPLCYGSKQKVTFNTQMAGFNLIKNLFKYLFSKKGPFAVGGATSGGFAVLDDAENRPDLQFHFVPVWGHKIDAKLPEMPKEDGVTMLITMLNPKSTGSIGLKSNDPYSSPQINLNYFEEQYDLDLAVEAFKLTEKLYDSKAFKPYKGKSLRPERKLQTDAEIATWIKENIDTCYHPVGTCKMGNDAMAVVDDELRVHGIQNLRVIDASVMPTIVRGNTNAPTIMIAEKAADIILNS